MKALLEGGNASMGPRSADRGISPSSAPIEAMARLQWGRDQLIAELRGIKEELEAHIPASMGPRSADRGIEQGIAIL